MDDKEQITYGSARAGGNYSYRWKQVMASNIPNYERPPTFSKRYSRGKRKQLRAKWMSSKAASDYKFIKIIEQKIRAAKKHFW
jgi:hypothetical protein